MSDKLFELTLCAHSYRNPGLADRVRILTIWPSAIRDAIHAIDLRQESDSRGRMERSQTPTTPSFKPSRHIRYLSKGREYVEELLHVNSSSKTLQTPTPTRSLFSPRSSHDSARSSLHEDRTQQMFQEAIRSLRNVDEFELNWYMDKGAEEYAWKFPFFAEIWQTIGPNLRKLTMDVQLFKMDDIVKYCHSLPKVEELYLTLRSDSSPNRKDLQLGPSNTSVPYLINKLKPTLRHLSIKTIGHQELSLNFQLLEKFPRLTSLSLAMPLDSHHLQDPSGFRQLLNSHPQITHLSVRYTKCCRDFIDDGFGTSSGKHMLYSDVSIPALQSLEVGLHMPIPPVGKISPLYNSIARIGQDFTSLTFTDRNLKLDEIRSMLRLFPSYRLKKLSLFAKYLSPQLIDLIAHTCPALNSLSLEVETVVRSEVLQSGSNDQDDVVSLTSRCYLLDLFMFITLDQDGFTQALFSYSVDLDNDRWRYVTWLLADISIMQWQFKVGHQHNWACMKAIAQVVPSVRSFAGRGHMEVKMPMRLEMQESRFFELGLDEAPRGFDI